MKKPARGSGQTSIAGIGDLILLTLLLLTGMALFAPLQEGWRLEKRLRAVQATLNDLEILYPVYVEIATLDKPARWPSLKLPVAQKLSKEEVPELPTRFARMAGECELEFISATPRVRNSGSAENYLEVEISVAGAYGRLEPFAAGLARLPVLDSIRKVEIRRETGREQFNILVRLLLAG